MDRRSFITLTAVTGSGAALASCGNPEHQLIRFVPDEERVPGVAEWKPSVCPLCQSGCGLIVRVMEADVEVERNGQHGVVRMGVAKKLEGNPTHPISKGSTCARGQAAIQVTYHPDRMRQPLKRTGTRGGGTFQPITWDDAIRELVSRLDALESANNQKALAVITAPSRGERRALIEQFADKFGAPPPIVFELFSDDVLRAANEISFGRAQLPTFDLARARHVLGIGADFLGTWNSPVAHAAAYGQMRRGRPGIRGGFVQVESRMTQTGANADEWVPIAPGTEGLLALSLANVIQREKLRPADAAGRAGSVIEGWSNGLPDYAPERVERQIGIRAQRIERLAREFAERRPSVAIIGGPPLAHTNGLLSAVAVNALNALTGSIEQPGGIFFTPHPGSTARRASEPPASIDKLAASINSASRSPVEVLIVESGNPVFATPRAWKVREALEKVPFIVSFGSFIDETTVLADLILPDHSFLESWVESEPESGVATTVLNVAPPVMKPLHQTRAMPDVLLDVATRLHRPVDLGGKTFESLLQKRFAALPSATPDGDPWAAAQKQGGWWGELPKSLTAGPNERRPSRTLRFEEPQFDGDAGLYPFHFLPYASSAFLDGSLAHLPWLQELPDPLTSAMWSTWVEINPQTAERLGIGQRDIVEIASRHGAVRAAAFVSPAIAPDLVAIPVGQGHSTYTRFASGRGENPVAILAPMTEPETGTLAWAATRVRIARVGPSDGRLVLFAGALRESPREGETR
jgi:anaerobic selenocysteine-containing dehydrogenase